MILNTAELIQKIEALNRRITESHDGMLLYQKKSGRVLYNILNPYENKPLSLKNIASIATSIVCEQIFKSGNHRTAVGVCYLLLLNENKLLRIKPYLLYAAVDFEYFKRSYASSLQLEQPLLQSNAIFEAMKSRVINPLFSDTLKEKHYERIVQNIIEIPVLLTNIKEHQDHKNNRTRKRLFLAYAGNRPDFSHSTSISSHSYDEARCSPSYGALIKEKSLKANRGRFSPEFFSHAHSTDSASPSVSPISKSDSDDDVFRPIK